MLFALVDLQVTQVDTGIHSVVEGVVCYHSWICIWGLLSCDLEKSH